MLKVNTMKEAVECLLHTKYEELDKRYTEIKIMNDFGHIFTKREIATLKKQWLIQKYGNRPILHEISTLLDVKKHDVKEVCTWLYELYLGEALGDGQGERFTDNNTTSF
jgi:hypothetical protein